MSSSDTQVIVIGAGLAGLSTARTLQDQGIDTLVLEARNRIGGRVLTHTAPNGAIIDMGAQIVGPRQHRMNALATKAGARLVRLEPKGRSVHEPTLSLSLIDKLNVARLAWRVHKEARNTDAKAPWLKHDAQHLDSVSTSKWLLSVGTPAAAAVWSKIANRSFCIDSQKFSALEALQHLSSMGGLKGLATADMHYLENGAATLTDYLARGLSVLEDTPVDSIKITGDQVYVTANNQTWRAKQVVLAVPPQIGHALLAPNDAKAIGYMDAVITGDTIKTALIYATPWWRTNGFSGMAVSDIGPVNELIDSTPKQAKYGCLMALSTGSNAQNLSSNTQLRTNAIIDHIDKLFSNNSHQPLYTESIDWIREPYSLGAYSSVRVPGSWTTQSRQTNLSERPIHMAGTEFANEWRSYMEGALASAEQTAINVSIALKN